MPSSVYTDDSDDMQDISPDRDDLDNSTSVTTATHITDYRYEHGRRYHAFRDGEYWAPNDIVHQEHEEILHYLFLMTMEDRLFLAPLPPPETGAVKRVLDVGTGLGLWASDFGDKYPDTEVIGTDLSPTQTTSCPANVRFEIDDINSEWTYPSNHFDFIHIRTMVGSVTDWLRLYRQAMRCLKPGGYIEHNDFNMAVKVERADGGPVPPSNPVKTYCSYLVESGNLTGKSMDITGDMPNWIREAGFTDLKDEWFFMPLGSWPTDPKQRLIGEWNLRSWDKGIEGWILAFATRHYGMDLETARQVVEEARKVPYDHQFHCGMDMLAVNARKPL